jgi:hypothetical protein
MAMHLERVGGWFVAATVLLAVAGNAAFAQEHKTYRCKVADVVSWEDDGRLRPDSNPRHWKREDYDGVIIDTLTGAMTHPDGHRVTWSIIQRGDRANDYVLTQPPTVTGLSSDQFTAMAATDFIRIIRIRTWSEKPTPIVRFLALGLSTFASGPCEVVR